MTTHRVTVNERSKLDPEWLRRQTATPNAVLLIVAELGPLIADALEIADESSAALIESESRTMGDGWLSTSGLGSVAQSARYLESRGLLERYPDGRQWVRFRERTA